MISIFKGVKNTKPIRNMEENSFFDGVKNGEWQIDVMAYRQNPTKENKQKLECVTASGTFDERAKSKLVEHSGLICIDIDAKDQISNIDIEALKNDAYVYVIHKSVGGQGLAVYFKVDKTKHDDAFLGLEKYLFEKYLLVTDKSCKDVSRLRFVSFDPDLYINSNAKTFKKYLLKKDIKVKEIKQIVVKSDFDEMVNQAKNMNLFDDYENYIKLAFALSSEFGENGRDYFHTLCQSSTKYSFEKSNKDYDIALKREGTGITIKTVYFKFKEAGIQLMSEKTKEIQKIAKLSNNPEEELSIRGIIDEENLIEQFKEKKESETKIDLIIELIKINKIVFNEVLRNYEFGKELMNDRVLANFNTQVWTKIDENISKDKIFNLIQDKDIVPSYNPIHKWFNENCNLKTDNEFKKLLECFEIEAEAFVDGKNRKLKDYLKIFLKKWLLGIISSAHGVYSLLILVLIGEQRTDKSRFFRNLLPEKLRMFYAESPLDEGKDSEILMTKKLLILDDEFAGKSKRDASKLKRLSSQQTFTIRAPYGRVSEDLQRLAVLCGTSNEQEVINDPTGNRRIIPVNIKNFDFEKYLKIDKDKLFIELYNEWREEPESWFLSTDEIKFLNLSTIKNTEVMSEEELINKYFRFSESGKMTNTDVMMKLQSKHLQLKTTSKRIGQALKKAGFEPKIIRENEVTKRVYSLIEKTEFDVTD